MRPDAGNSIRHFSIDDLAQHCRATGLRARRIAELENCDHAVEDQYFLAGLLHDVGELILADATIKNSAKKKFLDGLKKKATLLAPELDSLYETIK